MGMKGFIVYDTSHGNNKIVAEAVAETLKGEGFEVETCYVKEAKKLEAKDYSLTNSMVVESVILRLSENCGPLL